MDTRFWGPSGWRLLHMITFASDTLPTSSLRTFFETLPFVLPCKYCRASLTDYVGADPIPKHLGDVDAMSEWMYRIHNRVNGKLREQKLLDTPDPRWSEIRQRYQQWITAPCTTRRMMGWDFLFSVAFTTPSPRVASSPMPGAPPKTAIPTPALQNRWNLLSREARLPFLRTWWSSLAAVLPFQEWRTAWEHGLQEHGEPPLSRGRKAMTAWLYRMEKSVCQSLQESIPHDSFEGLCSELETFSSGCGKSKKSKTCRATKRTARQTLKKRRRSTYRATGGYL